MDDEETEQLLKTQGKPAKDETWNPKGTLTHRVGSNGKRNQQSTNADKKQ